MTAAHSAYLMASGEVVTGSPTPGRIKPRHVHPANPTHYLPRLDNEVTGRSVKAGYSTEVSTGVVGARAGFAASADSRFNLARTRRL